MSDNTSAAVIRKNMKNINAQNYSEIWKEKKEKIMQGLR